MSLFIVSARCKYPTFNALSMTRSILRGLCSHNVFIVTIAVPSIMLSEPPAPDILCFIYSMPSSSLSPLNS